MDREVWPRSYLSFKCSCRVALFCELLAQKDSKRRLESVAICMGHVDEIGRLGWQSLQGLLDTSVAENHK